MARKLLGKIDLTKIDKNRITEESYEKDGQTIIKKMYAIDIVLLDDTKVIKEYDTFNLEKKGFITNGQTKEEREAKTKSVALGDVLEFKDKGQPVGEIGNEPQQEEVNPSEIPF